MLRLGSDKIITSVIDSPVPLGTLTVNVVGALGLGFFVARRERSARGPAATQFWAIGLVGSYTTFSAFGAEAVGLANGGEIGLSLTYLALSLTGGLLAAHIGLRVGSWR